jgi:hypothetical protein
MPGRTAWHVLRLKQYLSRQPHVQLTACCFKPYFAAAQRCIATAWPACHLLNSNSYSYSCQSAASCYMRYVCRCIYVCMYDAV